MEEGQFCYWHIKSNQSPEGTGCTAHLQDGMFDKCPYTIKDIVVRVSPVTKTLEFNIPDTNNSPLGQCADFQPLEVIANNLLENFFNRLKESYKEYQKRHLHP